MSISGPSKHNKNSISLLKIATKSLRDKSLPTYSEFLELLRKHRALLYLGKQGSFKHVPFTYLEYWMNRVSNSCISTEQFPCGRRRPSFLL